MPPSPFGVRGGISKIQINPMVKINKTLGLALLTALAASCSSDNDVALAPEPVNNNGSAAYATLRIDLPTQQGSRAVTFDDGLPDEYKVHDATLLVFKKAGSSEGDYTFVEKVDLGDMTPWTKHGTNSTDGITTTADVTAKLTVASYDFKNNDYYGLVILNDTALTQTESEEEESTEVPKITFPTKDETYSTWNAPKSVTSSDNMSDFSLGIVMANAPEWKGTNQVPTTLVKINGDNVKATEAQAKAAGPAAVIHVERGLAKVTMEQPTVTTPSGSAYSSDKVTINAWALDVTNNKSFPVHNIDGLVTDYSGIWTSDGTASTKDNSPSVRRFVDGANTTFKRVYWGKDPNYNTAYDACKADFDIVNATDFDKEGTIYNYFGDQNPQYCLENTFDIDHMKQGQTTRVLLKATYKIGDSDAQTFYKFGKSNKLYTEEELIDAIKNAYVEKCRVKGIEVNKSNVIVNLRDPEFNITTAGVHTLKADNVYETSAAKPRTRGQGEGSTTHEDGLPTEQITTYENGVCYYIGRIKHFGDDETPWHVGDPTYGGKNLEYLGRYGVLRNNWYSLSVNSVSGPGEPTVPPVKPDEPDDENYNYIDLSVKILQWAKRTQGLDL